MSTTALIRIGLLIPERWRQVHRAYASLAGFFWLPCPLCGTMSGGHEWRDIDGKPSSVPDPEVPGRFHGICPACTRTGAGSVSVTIPGESDQQ
jgi:hypothetical protein